MEAGKSAICTPKPFRETSWQWAGHLGILSKLCQEHKQALKFSNGRVLALIYSHSHIRSLTPQAHSFFWCALYDGKQHQLRFLMWVITDNTQLTLKFSSARGTIILGKGLYLLLVSATQPSLLSRGREGGREGGKNHQAPLRSPWKHSSIVQLIFSGGNWSVMPWRENDISISWL